MQEGNRGEERSVELDGTVREVRQVGPLVGVLDQEEEASVAQHALDLRYALP